jgi:hypothetical protein
MCFASGQRALSGRSIHQLIPFVSTYLSETGLSNYAAAKPKNGNRLHAAQDDRIQFSDIKPDVTRTCEDKRKNNSLH